MGYSSVRTAPPSIFMGWIVQVKAMPAAGSLVTGAGFFALLAAGPALDRLDIAVIWGVIAAPQSAAAALFARAAFRAGY